MSIQAAFLFIQRVRLDETLRENVAALSSAASGQEVSLARLVEVAQEAGFDFTVEELQEAYRHDWAMRWARYSAGKRMVRE